MAARCPRRRRNTSLSTRIRGECARMNLLIEDLLQLARVTRGDPVFEWLELDLLPARSPSACARAGRGRRHRVRDRAPGLTVWGDRRLLGIALANLFDNACKFTRAACPRPGSSWAAGSSSIR